MNEHSSTIEEELSAWLEGAVSVVVAGIGNSIRKDDNIGVKIVEDLRGKVPGTVHLIECETAPESFVDEIVEKRPSHVLLIDAAILGLAPGESHLYDPEEVMGVPNISTHALPLRVFCDYVRELTGAKIALVLIEPKETGFGEGLSEELEKAEVSVANALLRSLR